MVILKTTTHTELLEEDTVKIDRDTPPIETRSDFEGEGLIFLEVDGEMKEIVIEKFEVLLSIAYP